MTTRFLILISSLFLAAMISEGCSGTGQYNGYIIPPPSQNGQTQISYTSVNSMFACALNPGGQTQAGVSQLYCWGLAAGLGLTTASQASLFASYLPLPQDDDPAEPTVTYFNSGVCIGGPVYSVAAVVESNNGATAPTTGPWTDTYCWQITTGNTYTIPASMLAATVDGSPPGQGVFAVAPEFTFTQIPPIGSTTTASALLAGGVISNSGSNLVQTGTASCTLSNSTYNCGTFSIPLQ